MAMVILQYKDGVPSTWAIILDGTFGDYGIGGEPHSSGNVYGAGRTYVGGTQDTVAFKLNSGGALQWQRLLNTDTNANTGQHGVAVDSSENMYVGGSNRVSSRERHFLAKYNSSGTIQWQRRLYNTGYGLSSIGVALDSTGSNVYSVGNSFNYTGSVSRGLVVKYNSSGTFQWEREIAAPTTSEEVTLYAMTLDGNDDLLLVGRTNDDLGPGTLDTVVMKMNSTGAIVWQQYLKLRSPTLSTRGTFGVVTDSSNNVFITGNTWDTTQDGYVAKLNSTGTLQWARGIDDNATSDDEGESVALDASGNVYVAAKSGGASTHDIRLMKWDTSGVLQWTRKFGGAGNDIEATIKIDDSGLIHLLGTTSTGISGVGNSAAIFHVKLDDNLGTFGPFTYATDTVTESEARTFTVSAGALTSAAAGVFTEEDAGLTESAASLTEINHPKD